LAAVVEKRERGVSEESIAQEAAILGLEVSEAGDELGSPQRPHLRLAQEPRRRRAHALDRLDAARNFLNVYAGVQQFHDRSLFPPLEASPSAPPAGQPVPWRRTAPSADLSAATSETPTSRFVLGFVRISGDRIPNSGHQAQLDQPFEARIEVGFVTLERPGQF